MRLWCYEWTPSARRSNVMACVAPGIWLAETPVGWEAYNGLNQLSDKVAEGATPQECLVALYGEPVTCLGVTYYPNIRWDAQYGKLHGKNYVADAPEGLNHLVNHIDGTWYLRVGGRIRYSTPEEALREEVKYMAEEWAPVKMLELLSVISQIKQFRQVVEGHP